jgi:predicted dehydrogenase
MTVPMNRREMLRSIGLTAGALASYRLVRAQEGQPHPLGRPSPYAWIKPGRPVTAAIMGAGGRGRTYAGYAQAFPEELKIVGVAEPIPNRNEFLAKGHGIPPARRWDTWERAFEVPKFCDAIIITTPDHLHYGPAMAALKMGYHLLLEKAIAQSWTQCNDILALARRTKAIVGICHVLRYTPYFRMMKHVVDSGRLGRLLSIQHLEPVEHIHMSHSFVRGNWRNSRESNPMLLSKSCHDLDILRWVAGRACTKVQSFGSLRLFREDMAPPGAPARCADGCPVESKCPFSALEIYLRRKTWLGHKDTPGDDDASIREWLGRTNYGRCVYRCDNDVVDNQVVNLEFGDISASFAMEGLTSYAGRRTRIMGARGDLVGDENQLDVYDFYAKERFLWTVLEHGRVESGHGGGDNGLVRDWVQAVGRSDESLLTTTLEASMESHLIGFTAERSRLEGGTLKVVDGRAPGTGKG